MKCANHLRILWNQSFYLLKLPLWRFSLSLLQAHHFWVILLKPLSATGCWGILICFLCSWPIQIKIMFPIRTNSFVANLKRGKKHSFAIQTLLNLGMSIKLKKNYIHHFSELNYKIPNPYVEVLTPNVMVFWDIRFKVGN